MQDSTRIPVAVARRLKHYVYLYSNPLDNSVFYIGKGSGARALAHLEDVDKRKVQRIIREIRSAGKEPQIEILAHSLPDAATALKVEAAAIDLVGIGRLANLVRGHGARLGRISVEDLVARYTRKPVPIREPSLLIRPSQLYHYGITEAELYDATRSAWRVGPDRDRVELAFAVFEGVVREVYRVAAWLPAGSTFNHRWHGRAMKRAGRWEFVGVIAAAEIRKRYLNRYVGHYFTRGGQNPIAYVNIYTCSPRRGANAEAGNK
jgi:hypothetical protein